MCGVEGCERAVNRDGLCFTHKIKTIRVGTEPLKREREGTDVTMGMGTEQYAKRMYAKYRAEGKPDPIPENTKAARYAPAKGVFRDKKYKEANA